MLSNWLTLCKSLKERLIFIGSIISVKTTIFDIKHVQNEKFFISADNLQSIKFSYSIGEPYYNIEIGNEKIQLYLNYMLKWAMFLFFCWSLRSKSKQYSWITILKLTFQDRNIHRTEYLAFHFRYEVHHLDYMIFSWYWFNTDMV